jgi:hypothetical protein
MVLEASLILTPLMALFGYMLRRAFIKLETTMSEEEIRLLIADKLSPVHADIRNIDKELKRMDKKLDQLLRLVIDERVKHN